MVDAAREIVSSGARAYTGRTLRDRAAREHPRFQSVLRPPEARADGAELARQIRHQIRATLPLKWEPGSYADYASLMDDFGRSADAVRRATDEARGFFEGIWRTNVDYRDDAIRGSVIEAYYAELHKRAAGSLIRPAPKLVAELEAMPVDEAEAYLRQSLDRAVDDVAGAVVEGLEALRTSELIGHIHWATPTACNAFCVQDVVTRQDMREHVDRRFKDVLSEDPSRNVRRVREEIRRVRTSHYVVQHAVRLFYLSDARQCRIDAFDQFIPKRVQGLLRRTPVWLKPLVRIIPGTRRTDITYRRDLFVEETVETVFDEERDEQIPRETHVGCPVVLLGNHVLHGWGDEETAVEAARQGESLFLWLAGLLLLLAAGLTGLGQSLHPALGWLAAIAAPVSLAAFVAGLRERAVSRRQPVVASQLAYAGLGWVVLSLGLLGMAVGVTGFQWPLLCVGGLLLGIGGKMLLGVLGVRGG